MSCTKEYSSTLTHSSMHEFVSEDDTLQLRHWILVLWSLGKLPLTRSGFSHTCHIRAPAFCRDATSGCIQTDGTTYTGKTYCPNLLVFIHEDVPLSLSLQTGSIPLNLALKVHKANTTAGLLHAVQPLHMQQNQSKNLRHVVTAVNRTRPPVFTALDRRVAVVLGLFEPTPPTVGPAPPNELWASDADRWAVYLSEDKGATWKTASPAKSVSQPHTATNWPVVIRSALKILSLAWQPQTRSSAQGNCSAKSLAPVMLSIPGRGRGSGGGRGIWQGEGGLAGEGEGGRGHFIHLAMYCTTTWCFALKGLRTITKVAFDLRVRPTE